MQPYRDIYIDPEETAFANARWTPPTDGDRPWLTIWLRPRATMRALLDRPRGPAWVLGLAAANGAANAAPFLMQQDTGLPVWAAMVLGITLGLFSGIISLYIFGWVLWSLARTLFGMDTRVGALRAALAWASLPNALTLPLSVLAVVIAGDLLPIENPNQIQPEDAPVLLVVAVLSLANAVLAIWSVVITICCCAEAMEARTWQAATCLGIMLFMGLLLVTVAGAVGLVAA